jgi:antirestriction protein ArdC
MAKMKTRKEVIEALQEKFAKMTQEQLREALKCYSRFHNYSLSNTFLIYLDQMCLKFEVGEAVASFKKWNDLGRRVKKGQHGIAIYAPRFVNKTHEKDGVEEKFQALIGFVPVYVFSYSQTEGEEFKPENHEVNLPEYQEIKNLAISLGYNVVEHEELGNPGGDYCFTEKRIRINLASDHALNTLVHELAHALRHEKIDAEKWQRDFEEVVAELVSCIVTGNVSDRSAAYLHGWSSKNVEMVVAALKPAEKISKKISEMIDKDKEVAVETEVA